VLPSDDPSDPKTDNTCHGADKRNQLRQSADFLLRTEKLLGQSVTKCELGDLSPTPKRSICGANWLRPTRAPLLNSHLSQGTRGSTRTSVFLDAGYFLQLGTANAPSTQPSVFRKRAMRYQRLSQFQQRGPNGETLPPQGLLSARPQTPVVPAQPQAVNARTDEPAPDGPGPLRLCFCGRSAHPPYCDGSHKGLHYGARGA